MFLSPSPLRVICPAGHRENASAGQRVRARPAYDQRAECLSSLTGRGARTAQKLHFRRHTARWAVHLPIKTDTRGTCWPRPTSPPALASGPSWGPGTCQVWRAQPPGSRHHGSETWAAQRGEAEGWGSWELPGDRTALNRAPRRTLPAGARAEAGAHLVVDLSEQGRAVELGHGQGRLRGAEGGLGLAQGAQQCGLVLLAQRQACEERLRLQPVVGHLLQTSVGTHDAQRVPDSGPPLTALRVSATGGHGVLQGVPATLPGTDTSLCP